jgi:DNA-binding NarL/FixJ family response regulator
MKLRCLIVDDNAYFLEAARVLLERQGIIVAGVASTGVDALRLAEELQPDVTLVDIDLGGESGFDLATRLTEGTGVRSAVILISTYPKKDFAGLIVASPAIGFLSKSDITAAAIHDLLGR